MGNLCIERGKDPRRLYTTIQRKGSSRTGEMSQLELEFLLARRGRKNTSLYQRDSAAV
jgi:hypothetical protein